MNTKNIVIFGATSLIAQHVAKQFATKKNKLFLVGRNQAYLSAIADDLVIRGCENVDYSVCDLVECAQHAALIDKAIQTLGHIDVVLLAHGTLPDQKACENNSDLTHAAFQTNLLSSISLLTHLANYFEQRKEGTLVVISSVAGDRGKRSNYVYGSAKAGLSTFLQGLRVRLASSNINVLTIKPGFVDTPMTKNFKKGLLWAKPEKIATIIVESIDKNRHEIYAPWFWRYIMMMINVIPERFFCRLNWL